MKMMKIKNVKKEVIVKVKVKVRMITKRAIIMTTLRDKNFRKLMKEKSNILRF
jgi:hypothetical protein